VTVSGISGGAFSLLGTRYAVLGDERGPNPALADALVALQGEGGTAISASTAALASLAAHAEGDPATAAVFEELATAATSFDALA
jgi:hypothetical protein